jgi:hypothetical protein
MTWPLFVHAVERKLPRKPKRVRDVVHLSTECCRQMDCLLYCLRQISTLKPLKGTLYVATKGANGVTPSRVNEAQHRTNMRNSI